MLLFTWSSLAFKTGHCFELFFRVMEKMKNGPAILMIVIGFVGVIGWLIKQSQYKKSAEDHGTLK